MAEIISGPERIEYAGTSVVAYKESHDVAVMGLPATHPMRLGMVFILFCSLHISLFPSLPLLPLLPFLLFYQALSYSVFSYEILNQPERAILLAKQAFDDAIVLTPSPIFIYDLFLFLLSPPLSSPLPSPLFSLSLLLLC